MNVNSFLYCETPERWLVAAVQSLPLLLTDHANCEKKAASTALNLMYRYVDKPEMMLQLSKLAREELRHFEQVHTLMVARGIAYEHLSPARYAGQLREPVRHSEPERLIDILIVSAIVEARSCERFERLIPVLDDELAEFYGSLLKSEARHFRVYLDLAKSYAEEPIDERVKVFLELDETLINSPDEDFRFHSGIPMLNEASS